MLLAAARGSALLQEFSLLKLLECLPQLLLCVHHDWPIPGHRFLERLSRNQKKADSVIACLDRDFVAAIEEHE